MVISLQMIFMLDHHAFPQMCGFLLIDHLAETAKAAQLVTQKKTGL